MATAPTEPTAPTDKQIALAWIKSGQWKINTKTHGLLYAEDNGLPGRTWVIKTPWKTHHALKRITNAQPIEHVKATYIRLLREVLSWPSDDTTFEPNHSHLEDLFLFRDSRNVYVLKYGDRAVAVERGWRDCGRYRNRALRMCSPLLTSP